MDAQTAEPDIRYDETADGIAILTFNRPHTRNALDLAAMCRFASLVAQIDSMLTRERESIRAVILTGAGSDAFCSGGDLNDLAGRPTEADALEFITIMGDALRQLEQLAVPVIAAINGYALGGGSEIATACDFRIIDDAAQMGFVQVRMALTPGWGAGQRLLRLVGYSRALAILIEGRPMGADELITSGLVHQVAPQGQALDAALVMARKIAAQPPAVITAIKRVLWAGLTQSYDDALATERALFPALWADEPHLRAVDAFLRRR